MSDDVKAMLAADYNKVKRWKFPGYIQPKLDGVRCMFKDGVAISRSGKPLPNKRLQFIAQNNPDLNGFDGEIVVGRPEDKENSTDSQSVVMTIDGNLPTDTRYYIYDIWTRSNSYDQHKLASFVNTIDPGPGIQCRRSDIDSCTFNTLNIYTVKSKYVIDEASLMEEFEKLLEQGHEGGIYRACDSHGYKYGRSTPVEQKLVKMKVFASAEATIVGWEELMHNENDPHINERGLQERSSHLAGMIAGNALGAFKVESIIDGQFYQFKVGTGFNASQRVQYWNDRESLRGLKIEFKYKGFGAQGNPLFPVFLRFRVTDVDGKVV